MMLEKCLTIKILNLRWMKKKPRIYWSEKCKKFRRILDRIGWKNII